MPPITREQFLKDRAARRGTANPERVESPVWSWLVDTKLSAYGAAREFDPEGDDPALQGDSRPGFCFDRMGCPAVDLPDGRRVWIAGEHEDHYDPDFYIYNDLVVRHPDGRSEIYAYPEDVFAPTDFHSATFDAARRCVWIVGNLGPVDARDPEATPVYRLRPDTFAIERVETSGENPGWIHEHTATLSADGARLTVSRGICVTEAGELIDQVDDWSLELDAGVWTRDTRRPFRRWSVERVDGEQLALFEMEILGSAAHAVGPEPSTMSEQMRRALAAQGIDPQTIEEMIGDLVERERVATEHFDPETLQALYTPPVEHRRLDDPDDDDGDEIEDSAIGDNTRFDSATVEIGDCRVRYREQPTSVELKIEGELPGDIESALRDDLVAKLSRLHGVACIARLTWEQ